MSIIQFLQENKAKFEIVDRDNVTATLLDKIWMDIVGKYEYS